MVAVMGFDGAMVAKEHVCSDQPSMLLQWASRARTASLVRAGQASRLIELAGDGDGRP
jgi:hypothetical protein